MLWTLPRSRLWGAIDARLDHAAMGLSGLCAVHCIATSVLLAAVASAGALLDPRIHEIGLTIAILFGVIGLGLGVMAGAMTLPEGGSEALWTIFGVMALALGHDLNRRATH